MAGTPSHRDDANNATQQRGRNSLPRPCVSTWWLAAVIGAIAYGSFIPFSIDLSHLRFDNLFGLSVLIAARPGFEDLVTNLLLYLPIGMAFHFSHLLSGRCSSLRGAATVGLGFAVSLTMEAAQTAIHGRVGSWIDVWLNTASTGLGFVLSAMCAPRLSRLMASWRGWSIARPYRLLWISATLGLLVYSLIPFDFVTSSAALHEAFRRAMLYPGACFGRPDDGSPGLMILGYLRDSLAFGVVGYLSVLAAVERFPGRRIETAHHSIHALALIVVIELLQLLTRSRVFDVLDIVFSQVCAIGGITLASAVVRKSALSLARWEPRRTFPTTILGVSVLAQGLAMFGPALLRASNANPPFATDGHLFALPFETLWRQPMTLASGDIAGQLAGFSMLGLGIAIILRRSQIGAAWVISAAVVVLAALSVAGINALRTVNRWDVTSPLIALWAAILVSRTYPRLRAVLVSSR